MQLPVCSGNLQKLEPSGVVNAAVFKALDRFDEELAKPVDIGDREALAKRMSDVHSSSLEDCDAAIQWALFMPDFVKEACAKNRIAVDHFEYQQMPPMRFVGVDNGNNLESMMRELDKLHEYKSGFDYDLHLMHHNGLEADKAPSISIWGRFMAADAPVPEGFVSDAMYDITRNIILGAGVAIPYPEKYWTAEAFLNDFDKPGTAYLFSTNS